MKVVVTGSSGLVGSALVPHLREQGHTVLTLVRRTPQSRNEARWDPGEGRIDVAALQGTDCVVHLAGAGVGDHRWTDSYKRTILRSRVDGTSLIARTVAALDPAPRVLVTASGIDFYPDSPDEVTEESPRGSAFLSDVVQAWEGAAAPAVEAGVSVSHARSALVLAPRGGVMSRLGPLVRLGVSGPIGSGRQWWSWITLEDHVRALTRLLDGDLPGPVNLASPAPATQRDLMRALASQVHRPSVLPVPEIAVRAAIGQFAETVVASHRVVPRRLLDAGFTFRHPTLAEAAPWVMG
ncbi:TIGR01777 family oxidoreductase [Angustibacter sp. McL0619]|uniref:TIGR01777 family oxidoreductase n=1 Tax=Angustibacter sp. McL0619 TaxID=3415676 RepID=UPI003CF8C49E